MQRAVQQHAEKKQFTFTKSMYPIIIGTGNVKSKTVKIW